MNKKPGEYFHVSDFDKLLGSQLKPDDLVEVSHLNDDGKYVTMAISFKQLYNAIVKRLAYDGYIALNDD